MGVQRLLHHRLLSQPLLLHLRLELWEIAPVGFRARAEEEEEEEETKTKEEEEEDHEREEKRREEKRKQGKMKMKMKPSEERANGRLITETRRRGRERE